MKKIITAVRDLALIIGSTILLIMAIETAATVLVLVGNVRVVDDLVDAGLGDAPSEGLPDVAGHGLAHPSPWLAVVAAGAGGVDERAAVGGG